MTGSVCKYAAQLTNTTQRIELSKFPNMRSELDKEASKAHRATWTAKDMRDVYRLVA
jgi:hypothetical protein